MSSTRGFSWVADTGGCLSWGQRLAMLPPMLPWLCDYVKGYVRLKLAMPQRSISIDVSTYETPKSQLAAETRAACSEQPQLLTDHGERSWLIALALAAIDGCPFDQNGAELLYCAALLHDYGLVHRGNSDFTLASARRAEECAIAASLSAENTRRLRDAICVHPTIGISPERDGPIGCYLQWGAMADLAGMRRWELGRKNISYLARSSSAKVQPCMARLIEQEAEAFRCGRFGLYCALGMTALIRLAPKIA